MTKSDFTKKDKSKKGAIKRDLTKRNKPKSDKTESGQTNSDAGKSDFIKSDPAIADIFAWDPFPMEFATVATSTKLATPTPFLSHCSLFSLPTSAMKISANSHNASTSYVANSAGRSKSYITSHSPSISSVKVPPPPRAPPRAAGSEERPAIPGVALAVAGWSGGKSAWSNCVSDAHSYEHVGVWHDYVDWRYRLVLCDQGD